MPRRRSPLLVTRDATEVLTDVRRPAFASKRAVGLQGAASATYASAREVAAAGFGCPCVSSDACYTRPEGWQERGMRLALGGQPEMLLESSRPTTCLRELPRNRKTATNAGQTKQSQYLHQIFVLKGVVRQAVLVDGRSPNKRNRTNRYRYVISRRFPNFRTPSSAVVGDGWYSYGPCRS
jgi:hypothetical protein